MKIPYWWWGRTQRNWNKFKLSSLNKLPKLLKMETTKQLQTWPNVSYETECNCLQFQSLSVWLANRLMASLTLISDMNMWGPHGPNKTLRYAAHQHQKLRKHVVSLLFCHTFLQSLWGLCGPQRTEWGLIYPGSVGPCGFPKIDVDDDGTSS